jgi:hypothetical protein
MVLKVVQVVVQLLMALVVLPEQTQLRAIGSHSGMRVLIAQ